ERPNKGVTMSQEQTAKRRGRKKTVTVLGAAGVLSLAGGASAAVVAPAADTLKADTASRHVITLSEEEIFDVSLATFYVYDKENSWTRLASPPPGKGCGNSGKGCGNSGKGCGNSGKGWGAGKGCGGGGCGGGGCGGGGCGGGGCSGCGGCGSCAGGG